MITNADLIGGIARVLRKYELPKCEEFSLDTARKIRSAMRIKCPIKQINVIQNALKMYDIKALRMSDKSIEFRNNTLPIFSIYKVSDRKHNSPDIWIKYFL